MAQRWLLIATFSDEEQDEPTVIGMGSVPKAMTPLATVLGRGKYLDDVRAVISRVLASKEKVVTASSDGLRRMIADPLIAYSGLVHGVYFWMGGPDEEPPVRDPAGAWYFNLTTGKIAGSDDLLDLYGVAPEDRRQERNTAEAFGRLRTNADESAALAKIVRAKPGTLHQATWTVARDDGQLRAANFACRMVSQVGEDGAAEVCLRGITHDIGPAHETPSAPAPLVLAEQVLLAERDPGEHRAIVSLKDFQLLRWLDDPMPGVAWENDSLYEPAIHPEDVPTAKAMSADLATPGRVVQTLRLRSVDGDWMSVEVSARLLLLDQLTTAALVTVTASPSS
jgi:hypothetical protein